MLNREHGIVQIQRDNKATMLMEGKVRENMLEKWDWRLALNKVLEILSLRYCSFLLWYLKRQQLLPNIIMWHACGLYY